MDGRLHIRQAYQLLHEGTLALQKAEQQGFRIDLQYVDRMTKRLTLRIDRKEDEFKATKFYRHWLKSRGGKININSNKQLADFLYNTKGLTPAKYTEKGTPSTDDEALRALDIPELNILLDVVKLKKLRDTYLIAYTRETVDGVLHPFYNLHTVSTYRSSSDRPNFQNIPKRDKDAMQIIRDAIYPREGSQLMEMDFSGIEVSIAACYHKDPVMLDYLIHEKDLHGDMAMEIFKIPKNKWDKHCPRHKLLRGATKNGFVFPQFYGDYYKNNAIGLCEWTGLPQTSWTDSMGVEVFPGITIGQHFRENQIKSFDGLVKHMQSIERHFWDVRFKVYKRWKEKWWEEYQTNGVFYNYTGFSFKELVGKNQCINYPVQSAAFHCLLWTFVKVSRLLEKMEMQTKLIGQVHDSLVFDVAPDELDRVVGLVKMVVAELPKIYTWINVPMRIEAEVAGVDESWAKVEEFKI